MRRSEELARAAALCAALSLSSAPGCGGEDADGVRAGAEPDGAVLVLNEALVNEAGSDVSGEFVELVNLGDEAADLTGHALADGFGVRHEFEGTIAPGQAVVVFGSAAGIRSDVAGAVPAASGALGLSNGGDVVSLIDASGVELDAFDYDGALSGTDGVSINRASDGDPAAGLVLHTELSDATSSPGTRADGSRFDDDQPLEPPGPPEPPQPPEPPEPPPPGEGVRLRVVAANLTSGNDQSYDLGHGVRILQGLRPDVALVSEMNFRSNGEGDIRAFVDQAFGAEFQYARQDGVSIPCGVVSRFPIVDSGVVDDPTLTDRDFAFARIDLPGERDLWAFSVHLSGASSSNRAAAASALVDFIETEVPAADLLVVGGDFNTDSRSEASVDTLGQVVAADGPFPVDQGGDEDTNEPRNKPYDWVLADPDLDALEIPTRIGEQEFERGLVFDSRVFRPLSDVAPIEAGDSGAPSMQHMAVVRDFEVAGRPDGSAPAGN
jgi:endonuclease/exonuclease/phosphatase family metal-dependent hydrolase